MKLQNNLPFIFLTGLSVSSFLVGLMIYTFSFDSPLNSWYLLIAVIVILGGVVAAYMRSA
jgi:hypothetical protein